MSGDPDVKFNGISTINISAAHISLSSLNTYALLAQVVDAPINGSNIIVQTLPWDRMKLDGDVYLNSGTWQHGGKLKISSLSTITRLWGSSINASEIYANSANLGGVRATTVSTFYMSTFGADLRGFTFNEGAGNYLSVGILSVGVAQFSTLTFTDFLANFISTSSILGNSGLFSNVTTSTVTFWDTLYRTYNALEFRGGNFYINGLTPVLSNVIRDFQLLSTTAGLYTLNDTTSNALQSDITTLSNTFDIASSNLSTNTGSTFSTLQKAISTSSSNLSTAIGLSLSTLSTTTGWQFSTAKNVFSTLRFAASSISAGSATLSSLSTHYAAVSSANISFLSVGVGYFNILSAATLFADVVSTAITQDIVQLNVDQFNASTAIISTILNISAFTREFHASTAHFVSLSTTYITAPIISSLSSDTGANFLSLSGTVSSGFISTVRGLGTSRYVSSTWFDSTILGLGTLGYTSQGILTANLISTTTGLGTSGYVSTTGLQTALTSSLQGAGTLNYVSTASLTSSLRGLGTLGYLSVAVNSNQLTSTTLGLGTLGYLSTPPLALSTRQFYTSSIDTSSIRVADTFSFSTISTFSLEVYGSISSHVDALLKVSSLTVPNTIEANQIRGFTNGLDFLFFIGSALESGTTIRYSRDGNEWFNAANTFTSQAYSFAVGPRRAIASGSNVVGNTYIKQSVDGISWNSILGSNVDKPVNYVFYADDRFYASATDSEMYYSDDGLTWANASGGFSVKGNGFAYAPETGVLVAGGETSSGSNIKFSEDRGSSWQNQVGGFDFTLPVLQIAYQPGYPGMFLAASGKRVYKSVDGKNWTDHLVADLFTQIYGVIRGKDKWIAFGEGSPTILYSFDGTVWLNDSVNPLTTRTVSVTYGNNRYVATGASGGFYRTKYSLDGITWIDSTVNPPTGQSFGVNACQFTSTETPVFFYKLSTVYANVSSLTANEGILTKLDANVAKIYDTLSTENLYFSTGFGNYETLSSLTVLSTVLFRDNLIPNLFSNVYLSNGSLYLQQQAIVLRNQLLSTVQGLATANYVSTSILTSSLIGLGTLEYVSTASLYSSLEGLGTFQYVSTASLYSSLEGLGTFQYVSTASLYSSLEGLGTFQFVSTQSLTSSLDGLGTLGYLSTGNIVTPPELTSTTIGLGTLNYVSTASLRSSLEGLGTFDFVSTPSLRSSLEGLGTFDFVSTASLRSSLEGLGTFDFVSTPSLTSSLQGLGKLLYVSSTQLISTTNRLIQSITSTSRGLGTLGYLSTAGTGDVTKANLTSTTIGLGTLGYLSTGGGGGPVGPQIFTSSIFASTLTVDFIHGKLVAGSNSNVGAAGGDYLVCGLPAPGSLRTIKRSTDAMTWTDSGAAFTQETRQVVYNDSIYWAMGINSANDRVLLKSLNQLTWTSGAQEDAVKVSPQKMYAYLNKTWLLGRADDAGEEAIWYRTNGQNTWTSIPIANPVVTKQPEAACMAVNSQFVVIGGKRLHSTQPDVNFLWSDDGGVTFNPQLSGSPVNRINDVMYLPSQNKYFAVGFNETPPLEGWFYESTNGKDWTIIKKYANFLPFQLKYINNKFWAMGAALDGLPTIRTSTDLQTWNTSATNTFTGYFIDMVYDPLTSKYIGVGSNTSPSGNTPIKTSLNGLTWTNADPPPTGESYAATYFSVFLPPPGGGSFEELPVRFSTISTASLFASTLVARHTTTNELGAVDITTLSTISFVDRADDTHIPALWWSSTKLYVSSKQSPAILLQDVLSVCTQLNTWATNNSLPPPF